MPCLAGDACRTLREGEPAAARADIAQQPGGVTYHQTVRRHRTSDHGPRANQRESADRHPRQNDASRAYGTAITKKGSPDLPVVVTLQPALGCNGTRMSIIGDTAVRPEKYSIFQRGPMEHAGIVLNLATAPYGDLKINIDAFAKDALSAHSGALAYLYPTPDTRRRTDLGLGGYFGGRVYTNVVTHQSDYNSLPPHAAEKYRRRLSVAASSITTV